MRGDIRGVDQDSVQAVRFAIRDDDANFFTRPEQLERVYGEIWQWAPVSIAAVPFHASTRSGAIPAEHWDGDGQFPLADNGEILSYLIEQQRAGRVSFLLHGYSHRNYEAGYEFEVGPDLDQRISKGRAELERLFGGQIRTFVPPHNALSRRGLEVVDRAGMDVLGSFMSFHPRRKPWDRHTIANYLRIALYRQRTGRGRENRLVYPYALRYKNHAEFGCHALIPSTTLDDLLAGFEEARRWAGDFCLATHYWEISESMHETLQRLLEHASRAGVTFVHADRLFDRVAA